MAKTEFGFFLGIFLILILASNVGATIIWDETSTNFTIVGDNVTEDFPPAAITNLILESKSTNSLNWRWDNPLDEDFAGTIISIDGVNVANLSSDKNSYNATGLSADTIYTISVRTRDLAGNVNESAVERSDRTDKAEEIKKKKCTTSTSEYLKTDVVDSTEESKAVRIVPVEESVSISTGKNSQTNDGMSIAVLQIALIIAIAIVLLMLVYFLLVRLR